MTQIDHNCIQDELTILVWSPGCPIGAHSPFATNRQPCDDKQHYRCAQIKDCRRFEDYEWWTKDGTPGPNPFTVCTEWVIRVGKYVRGAKP